MIRKIGLVLFIAGILLYVAMAAAGIVHVGLFIIFPFFISTSLVSIIPFLLILSGILLLFLSPVVVMKRPQAQWPEEEQKGGDGRPEKKFGGLIMIGPIPIIFGNDRRIVYILAVIAAVVLLILLLYYLG